MKVGFYLPNLGPQATRENVHAVAEEAEQLGYDSLWVVERLLFPLRPKNPYGNSPTWPSVYLRNFDPLDTLFYAAARTERVQLGTSVLVVPFYNPVVLARRFATLDVLSEGRALCGLGIGWSADEYEAAGVAMRRRGAREEEFLTLMKEIWTKDTVEFSGQFYRVPPSRFELRPVQKPHPPIILGAYTEATFPRIARLANGWNGFPGPHLAGMVQKLREAFGQAGRDPATAEVVVRSFPQVLDKKPDGQQMPLVGTLDQIKQDVEDVRRAGATHLFFDLQFGPDGQHLETVQRRMKQLRAAAP